MRRVSVVVLVLSIVVLMTGRISSVEVSQSLPHNYQESVFSTKIRESVREVFPESQADVGFNGGFKISLGDDPHVKPETAATALATAMYRMAGETLPKVELSQELHLEDASIYRFHARLGELRVFPDRFTLGFDREQRLELVTGDAHPMELKSLPEQPAPFSENLQRNAGFGEFQLMKHPEPVIYSPCARSAWLLYAERTASHEAYELVLTGRGELLHARSLSRSLRAEEGPRGLIFPDGSPLPNWSLGAPRPPFAERQVVSLTGTIDSARKPMALEGHTVRSFDDRFGDMRPIFANPANGCEFCAPLQLTGPNPPDPVASSVNAHFWSAVAHDRLNALGFTKEAGNFEGDDPIWILEQSNTQRQAENSMFVGAPDGKPGKIFLFTWDGDPPRSSALDASLVIHEYGHGLTSRLAGLWGLLGGATDEAVADALVFLIMGYPQNTSVPIAAYAAQDPRGVRLFPYSTNPAIDPVTFADFPLLGASGALLETHYMGEILASTLWGIRGGLMDKHGAQEGIKRFGKLLIGTLMLLDSFPTFPEFRDTFLNVDKLLYNREDVDLIWQVCVKKKLGYLAYTNSQTFQDPFWTITSDDFPTRDVVFKAKVGYHLGRPQLFWFVLGDQSNSTTVATIFMRSTKTGDSLSLLVPRSGLVFVSPPVFIIDNAPSEYPKLKVEAHDTVIVRYRDKEFQIPID